MTVDHDALARAERHVAQAEEHVLRQVEIIQRLEPEEFASLEWGVPAAPSLPKREGATRNSATNIVDVLAKGPASFAELMASLGSRDGREIVRALDALYAAERLGRREDGRYVLKE